LRELLAARERAKYGQGEGFEILDDRTERIGEWFRTHFSHEGIPLDTPEQNPA
jgi:hypothetical protein